MTENEAKTKWCPMAKPGENKRPMRTMELWTERTHCVASDCMMWRWYTQDREAGYCGLAGKP